MTSTGPWEELARLVRLDDRAMRVVELGKWNQRWIQQLSMSSWTDPLALASTRDAETIFEILDRDAARKLAYELIANEAVMSRQTLFSDGDPKARYRMAGSLERRYQTEFVLRRPK